MTDDNNDIDLDFNRPKLIVPSRKNIRTNTNLLQIFVK
jgi:hypothetical protein